MKSAKRNLLIPTASKLVILIAALVIIIAGVFVLLPPAPASAPTGSEVEVTGTAMCLPHKNTDGPQTEECAFGIKAKDGAYYALRDSDSNYKNVSSLPMNEEVVIKGTLKRESSAIYPTIGTITITSVTRK